MSAQPIPLGDEAERAIEAMARLLVLYAMLDAIAEMLA